MDILLIVDVHWGELLAYRDNVSVFTFQEGAW